jgi:hypothetical protein
VLVVAVVDMMDTGSRKFVSDEKSFKDINRWIECAKTNLLRAFFHLIYTATLVSYLSQRDIKCSPGRQREHSPAAIRPSRLEFVAGNRWCRRCRVHPLGMTNQHSRTDVLMCPHGQLRRTLATSRVL